MFVPFGSKSKYESADIWKNFYNIVEYDFAGVEDVIIDEAIVSVENGRIVVEGAETVNVYSIDGKLLYNGNSQSIPTLGSSTYIVLVNGKIYKIAL